MHHVPFTGNPTVACRNFTRSAMLGKLQVNFAWNVFIDGTMRFVELVTSQIGNLHSFVDVSCYPWILITFAVRSYAYTDVGVNAQCKPKSQRLDILKRLLGKPGMI